MIFGLSASLSFSAGRPSHTDAAWLHRELGGVFRAGEAAEASTSAASGRVMSTLVLNRAATLRRFWRWWADDYDVMG